MSGTTMDKALDELKVKRFNDIAETIIKYQNYKTGIAVSKMDNSLGKSTRLNYLMYGIRYLKTGYKSCIVNGYLRITFAFLFLRSTRTLAWFLVGIIGCPS